MYKNVLQSIDNIAIWPVISFVIFFVFFIGLLWWVFTVDKQFIDLMSQLPMSKNSNEKQIGQTSEEKNIVSPNL
jgi:cytochrome c oxidase cbb3-type subunit IV